MTVVNILLIAAVIGSLAGIAVIDALRMTIDPRLVAALLAAGLLWRLFGVGAQIDSSVWAHVGGAALGVAVVAAPIAVAAWRGRRWPIYPGDGLFLGAIGGVLGIGGLAWVLIAGSVLALAHRVCVQRRRGRPIASGYLPLGPGMAAGAIAVFVAVNAGVVFAGSAVVVAPSGGAAVLDATELDRPPPALPKTVGSREIELGETGRPVGFQAAVERLAGLLEGDVRFAVEERPARVVGGGAVLLDPEPRRLVWSGPLRGLIEHVSGLYGYAWEWRAGTVVFFRYHDTEHPAQSAELVSETVWEVADLGAGPLEEATAVEAKQRDAVPAEEVPEKDARAGEELSEEGPRPAEELADKDVPPGEELAEEGLRPAEELSEKDVTSPVWMVDPETHGTLQAVLESWAARAGWSVEWRARSRYSVGARAEFKGTFLEAVDRLFSGPETARVLVIRAYANQYLVVDGAGIGG